MAADLSKLIGALHTAAGIDTPVFPRSVFHYTTLEAAVGIVDTGILRLSSVTHLNDTSELNYSLQVISECIEKRANGAAAQFKEVCKRLSHLGAWRLRVHVACFCTDGDLLSQWRGYAGGNGVSLGFDALALHLQLERVGGRLRPIIYDRPAQCDLVDRILHALEVEMSSLGNVDNETLSYVTQSASHYLLSIAPFFKAPAFAEEAEWRAVIELNERPTVYEIKMRAARGLLVPFLEWEWRKACDDADFEHLNKVVVGPGQHSEQNRESVASWLNETLDYPFIEVTKSAVPLRA